MPRPRRHRWIRKMPSYTFFKPAGVLASKLEEVILTIDEYEAVRLKDVKGLDQKVAADKMGISQPTFARLLESARKKISKAIVNGKAIKIEGGEYKMVRPRGRGLGQGRGAGRGRMGGPNAAGPGGYCVCPKCGYRKEHNISTPCYLEICPKCETKLVRE